MMAYRASSEGYPVLGSITSLNYPHPWVVVAIADSQVRKAITTYSGINIATLIHPSVSMSEYKNQVWIYLFWYGYYY